MRFEALRLVLVAGCLLVGGAAPPPHRPTPTCVPFALVTSPIATDDGHLLFRGQTDPKRSYVAAFRGGRCAGLDRFATVSVEPRTTQGYCGGDLVRVLRLPVAIPGPICTIDRLEPVDARVFD